MSEDGNSTNPRPLFKRASGSLDLNTRGKARTLEKSHGACREANATADATTDTKQQKSWSTSYILLSKTDTTQCVGRASLHSCNGAKPSAGKTNRCLFSADKGAKANMATDLSNLEPNMLATDSGSHTHLMEVFQSCGSTLLGR